MLSSFGPIESSWDRLLAGDGDDSDRDVVMGAIVPLLECLISDTGGVG